MKQSGSIIIALLWCLALLSIVVIGVLHTSRIDLVLVKNYGDRIQAHYLAVAGIEKAKALLYREALERSRSDTSHNGKLFDAPEQFRDIPLGRGQFRVFRRARPDEGGGILFGVSDEESRLNVNHATAEQFGKIEGLTSDIAAAIIDWRDDDNEVTPGGAEADYYLSLQPPYLPRNGPIQTLRELLMVRGITRSQLFARDLHQNGLLPEGDEADNEMVSDSLDLGWANLLTVNSSVENISAAGYDRVNIQTADEAALTGVSGITSDIAKAIVAYRGRNRFSSIADLLDVVAAQNQPDAASDANPPAGGAAGQPNNPGANPSGPRVISADLLMDVADELTALADENQPGLVNINTASLEVLMCLPGVSREMAQAIINFRSSSGFFANIAYLLKVEGMTEDLFKQIAPLVCTRSETYRILCEGKVKSSGARQRLEEIVHVGLRSVKTVSYREDDL